MDSDLLEIKKILHRAKLQQQAKLEQIVQQQNQLDNIARQRAQLAQLAKRQTQMMESSKRQSAHELFLELVQIGECALREQQLKYFQLRQQTFYPIRDKYDFERMRGYLKKTKPLLTEDELITFNNRIVKLLREVQSKLHEGNNAATLLYNKGNEHILNKIIYLIHIREIEAEELKQAKKSIRRKRKINESGELANLFVPNNLLVSDGLLVPEAMDKFAFTTNTINYDEFFDLKDFDSKDLSLKDFDPQKFDPKDFNLQEFDLRTFNLETFEPRSIEDTGVQSIEDTGVQSIEDTEPTCTESSAIVHNSCTIVHNYDLSEN